LQTETHDDFELQNHYGAIIRSLSGELSAEIRDWQLFYKATPFGLLPPHISLSNLNEIWADKRGILDGIALRLRYSEKILHQSLSPSGMTESFVFEMLEQIRVESVCPEELRGTKKNIQNQFIAWIQHYMGAGGTESSSGLLLMALFTTTWIRLNGKEVPQLLQDMLEATRAGLSEITGPLLKQLKANKFCQKEFSITSLILANIFSKLIENEYLNTPSIRSKRKFSVGSILQIEWQPQSKLHSEEIFPIEKLSTQEKRLELLKTLNNYSVFDRQYDVELEAKRTIRPAQLSIYQSELNQEIARRNIPWGKLTRIYKQIFSHAEPYTWLTTESEAEIDRRYLIRAATSPLQSPLYKLRTQTQLTQTKITLLIDCSGSMKEQRLNIAVWIDSLVRILEQAKIQTEVLGYSTVTWQGGKPFKEWRRSGQAPNPGRLNERAHWVFKDFKTTWRKSRPGISALLRPEIYTESIDGEAMLWAVDRLQKGANGKAFNKTLIIFSDGCPMDRATIQANGEDFLRDHFLNTIAWCEHQTDISLWGCGIGEELRTALKRRLSWEPDQNTSAEILFNWAAEFKKTLNHKILT